MQLHKILREFQTKFEMLNNSKYLEQFRYPNSQLKLNCTYIKTKTKVKTIKQPLFKRKYNT